MEFLVKIFSLMFLVVVLSQCADKGKNPVNSQPNEQKVIQLPALPRDVEDKIQKEFPEAMPAASLADTVLNYLMLNYRIPKEKIILGASTCVDDIIYTKNFHAHPEIKGPFHLGGLAGLPFTGISGLNAFAHHVPEGGTMLLLIESHIGYSLKKGWGYILRHEQHDESTCCGALMGTLDKLRSGTAITKITREDYQGAIISELAELHKNEIMNSETPVVTLTKLTATEAEKQIRSHILEPDLKHFNYIVIITGVLINTDYMYSDYQFMDHLLIYDVKQNKFIAEIKSVKDLK